MNGSSRVCPPRCQALECRTLLSATGPQLLTQQLLGDAHQVTGIVLSFSEALDPATAQAPAGYRIARARSVTRGGGLFDSVFDPFAGSTTSIELVPVPIAAVVYDAAHLSVTIIPKDPVGLGELRRLRIRGNGQHGLRGADGVRLDGNHNNRPGGNALIHYHSVHGSTVRYHEPDRDRVTLTLSGPGRLVLSSPRGPLVTGATLEVIGASLDSSILSGTVVQSRHGDGHAVIDQLRGGSTVQIALLSDPAFSVNQILP